jgi:protein-S-isoprenylcysteine O-methyltransferase Ste14
MSRWKLIAVAVLVWTVGLPLAHGVVPWAISLLVWRYGWIGGRPGIWNLLGLVPVSVGIALLIWTFVTGLLNVYRMPEKVEGLVPPYLVTSGPYALTRNPMYVGELALWLGWTILYGSVAVFITMVVLCALLEWVVLPREERTLEAQFGEVYRQYKTAAPRWLGKTQRAK